MANINSIKSTILEKVTSQTGIFISLITLFGFGFGAGTYFNSVISKGEIMELKNKQALEIIELRNKQTFDLLELKNKQTFDLIELQKKISLLEIENEKEKK